jgi:hypothetical protein
MNNKEQLTTIFKFIKANGKLVRRAQSAWGADRWELDCELGRLAATLEDDGYTQAIIGMGVVARQTCDYELSFSKGDQEKLDQLFAKIINLSLDIDDNML